MSRFPDLVLGHNPGADRTEGIEALARDPLLLAADDRINQAGITEDIFAPMFARDVPPLFGDDESQFAFVIDPAPGIYRKHDRIGGGRRGGPPPLKEGPISGPGGGGPPPTARLLVYPTGGNPAPAPNRPP